MRKSGCFAVVLSALATFSFAGDGIVHHMPEKVPNQYVVMMVPGHDLKALSNELAAAHAGRVAAVQEHLGTFTLNLPNETAAEHVARDPRIAYVQEDGILHMLGCRALAPDGSQWGLGFLNVFGRTNQFGAVLGTYLDNVQLYVIDSPVDTSKPDFAGKTVWVYRAYDQCTQPTLPAPGKNPIQADGSYNVNHGGQVASILVGNVNGVIPDVKRFTSVVIFNSSGCADDTSFNNAANYVVGSQRQLQGMGMPGVANMSFGTSVTDPVLDSAVQQMVATGIFVAAAAGNDYHDACYGSPSDLGGSARYPGMMSVGATNIYGGKATYSNDGQCVDIWAPGGEDPTYSYNKGVMSTDGAVAGTSYAAPAVAGAAISWFSMYPNVSPAWVWSALKSQAQTRSTLQQLHMDDDCAYIGYCPCPGQVTQ